MILRSPKKITFWAAVVLAVISLIIYILHSFFYNSVPYLAGIGYLLLLVAFGLLFLGITIEGL